MTMHADRKARADSVIAEIDAMFAAHGADIYGERVTQLQHAVQSAAAARAAGWDDAMIVACLLHDVGHLIHDDAGGAYDAGIDDVHEELGARWMAERFPAEVVIPARLHVASKRYLCTTEPGYHDLLSEASKKTLAMQGGPMSEAEAAAFRAGPFLERSVELRRFDDIGKNPDDHAETVADYHAAIRRVVMAHEPMGAGLLAGA